MKTADPKVQPPPPIPPASPDDQTFTVKEGTGVKLIVVSHRARGGKTYMAVEDDAALDRLISTLEQARENTTP